MTPTRLSRPALTVDDLHLLHRLHHGDRDAFADLYRLTSDILGRYVAARLRQRGRDAVEDLVHDAYCTALADPGLLGPDLLGSMLRLAARAVTRHDWSQRRYVRAAYTVYEDRITDADLRVQTLAVLRRPGFPHALARLTADQRRAIHLRYFDGYPRDHAAAAMGRSVQAVRGLERRALRRLQTSCAT